AVPEHRITQDDAAEQIASFCQLSAAQQQRLHQVHRQTGIATRHSVVLQSSTNGEAARQVFYERGGVRDTRGPSTAARMRWYEDHAGPLAAQAARRALERSAVLPDEVTHLVTVSCSGFAAPGPDYSLIQDLDLPRSVQRPHIGLMGCHGALNALRVAQAFCQADRRACVLIGAVELCTLHLQYGFEMQDVISNALFADGAAAAVCRAAELRAGDWSIAACGSHYLANS